MKANIKKMTISGLLVAISIMIPLVMPKIYIPPFSMTLASHVPIFIGMFFGPVVAIIVGIGSALGFLIAMGNPVIAARASMHIIVGVVGAILLRKKMKYPMVMIILAPIHGLLEALVVIPFGFTLTAAFITTGVGTIIHHFVDSVITYPIITALKKVMGKELTTVLEDKKVAM